MAQPPTQTITPPAAQSTVSAQERANLLNDPDVAKLHNLLMAEQQKPNVLTLADLERYRPIFAVEAAQQTRAVTWRDLYLEFVTRYDLYKPTVVIKSASDPTIVMERPPELTQLKTIEPTPETAIAAGAFALASQRDPDSPSAVIAFNKLMQAFHDTQIGNAKAIGDTRRLAEEIVVRDAERRGLPNPLLTPPSAAPAAESAAVDDGEVEWSIG